MQKLLMMANCTASIRFILFLLSAVFALDMLKIAPIAPDSNRILKWVLDI